MRRSTSLASDVVAGEQLSSAIVLFELHVSNIRLRCNGLFFGLIAAVLAIILKREVHYFRLH